MLHARLLSDQRPYTRAECQAVSIENQRCRPAHPCVPGFSLHNKNTRHWHHCPQQVDGSWGAETCSRIWKIIWLKWESGRINSWSSSSFFFSPIIIACIVCCVAIYQWTGNKTLFLAPRKGVASDKERELKKAIVFSLILTSDTECLWLHILSLSLVLKSVLSSTMVSRHCLPGISSMLCCAFR